MKNACSLLVLCLLSISTFAQIKMPAPSPTQTIKQDFGLGQIELVYSRPSLKGRTLFKDLAPYGQVWRTGANAATRLHFSDNVSIGGKSLDSGSYVLYTIPNAGKWTVIINKGLSNWGTDGYKTADDIVRFDVSSFTINPGVETFTMQFANVKPESCDLQLRWGTTAVSIPITTNVREKLKAQFDAAMQGDNKPYWQAAGYYYEWEKDYPKALSNVNSAIAASEKQNENVFYMYLLKARIQKEMKDKAGAKESANTCIQQATKAGNTDYVKLANELIASL